MIGEAHRLNPVFAAAGLWRRRDLIWQMTRRDVVGRYRGSVFGLLWSFVNPLVMLAVYTFFFSVIFNARWAETNLSEVDFAILLFAGLIVYNLFAEVVGRSPGLIVGNTNYVKKVVFPLEVLAVVATGSALFHATVSMLILVVFMMAMKATIPVTIVFLPIVIFPLLLVILALAWMLSSLGVYFRDLAQTVGILVAAMLFLSPIFYPVDVLPTYLRDYLYLNPLTTIIEQVREVLIWGRLPDLVVLGKYTLFSIVLIALAYIWFQKSRRGFADVL